MKEILPILHHFDNWTGLGLIARGMEREGYHLHLTSAEPGSRRAKSYSYPMTNAGDFGAAPTPWGAVQEAVTKIALIGPLNSGQQGRVA